MTDEYIFMKPCPFCMAELTKFGHDVRNGKVVTLYIHPAADEPAWTQCPLTGLVFDVERWNNRPLEDKLFGDYNSLVLTVEAFEAEDPDGYTCCNQPIGEEHYESCAFYRWRGEPK